ncbi:MAG TPA: ABC transporter permease [bacterium]|nr:ABC transporter permease [bacterium]HPN44442.1 ABC transporter permease [bacterium]
MQFKESINMSLTAIMANKMRSVLTLLGIIIGVMTIIAMQSLITGMRNSVVNQASVLGSNTFQVQKFPAIGGGDYNKYRNRKNLTREEADEVRKRVSTAENVGAEVWEFGKEIRYKDKKTLPIVQVAGATPEFLPNNSHVVSEGRFITNQDVEQARSVCIIGVDLINRLFPYESPLGKDIKIEGEKYEVIGIFESKGSFLGGSQDNLAAIPISRFEKMYGRWRSVNITIKAKSPELYQATIDQTIGVLRTVRKVPPDKENDFEIYSNDQFMEFFDKLTASVKIVAIAIASISLLVAGVGIMNIMLVSVTERTKEIGIRKSLGAKRKDILWQFMIEAIILSEIGGLIGIAVGLGIGFLVKALTPIPAGIPVWTVIIGLVFCSFVGIVFGVYPARKAALMDPITAMRYE